MRTLPSGSVWASLLIYGAAHGVVDGACAGIFFALLHDHIIVAERFIYWAIFYNVIAFGLRAPLGMMVDHFRCPRPAAVTGCCLVAAATMVAFSVPLWAITVAGIGNALYHVGGGGISFNLMPHRATAPGIFAAPGALGLGIGAMIGKAGHFTAWPFLILLPGLSLLMFTARLPEREGTPALNGRAKNQFGLVLLLTLLSVAIGSFIGLSLAFPWKSDHALLLILIGAVFVGRGVGGWLADRFGWRRIALVTSLVAIPLLALGSPFPVLAITGVICFNISVPVMLAVISNLLPGQASFAYGLVSLALISGGLAAFSRLQYFLSVPFTTATLMLLFALTLFAGLCLLRQLQKNVNTSPVKEPTL